MDYFGKSYNHQQNSKKGFPSTIANNDKKLHPNPLRMLDFKHNHHLINRMQIINYTRQLLILALMFFDVELYEALLIIEVAGPH